MIPISYNLRSLAVRKTTTAAAASGIALVVFTFSAVMMAANSVQKTLGRSGATGLAGGDHLHFAVLVGDTYVDPVEWWDAKWVETHIEDRWQVEPQAEANGG